MIRPARDMVTEKRKRILLFTGHAIDAPMRRRPRFPRTEAAEAAARQAIRKVVRQQLAQWEEIAYGIAGAASGGDILFHEVCEELGISTRVYQALPVEAFITQSVASAGEAWVERYHQLIRRNPPMILQKEALARDQGEAESCVWERANLWMLEDALMHEAQTVTVIALWDGGLSDGPGGIADLVDRARGCGAQVVCLPTGILFALA
jgi:hypothetical protein